MDNDTINNISFLTGMLLGGIVPLLILNKLDSRRSFWRNITIAFGLGVPISIVINFGIVILLCKYTA